MRTTTIPTTTTPLLQWETTHHPPGGLARRSCLCGDGDINIGGGERSAKWRVVYYYYYCAEWLVAYYYFWCSAVDFYPESVEDCIVVPIGECYPLF